MKTLILEMEPTVHLVQLSRSANTAAAFKVRFAADIPRRTVTLAGEESAVRLVAGILYGNAITTGVEPRPTGWGCHMGAVA